MHQAQVFCSDAMLLCLNCSDDLPDMLLLLSWEGARVLSAEPQDFFLANILSVAGLFEYPGKSSTNCRLARHVPKKQFYQNFWQKKKCLVWQVLFRVRCIEQIQASSLLEWSQKLGSYLSIPVHALGSDLRNNHFHPGHVIKCSLGQKAVSHECYVVQKTYSSTWAVSFPKVTY